MITKQLPDFNGLGKAIQISNEHYELVVTLDIGPRIIHFSLIGGANILGENVKESSLLPDGSEWRLYGGHRVWHSPESSPRTYISDSAPLDRWALLEDGVEIWQKEESWTHMRKSIRIVLDAEQIEVRNRITNMGAWPVETAVWAITVVSSGGMAICPVARADTGKLPNASYVTWPYTRLNDARVNWGEKYILLRQDPAENTEFKFGYSNTTGWAAYLNKGLCFIKRYTPALDQKYPDKGCSYEFYMSDWGLEMETLSPLRIVNPGGTLEHSEFWELHSIDGRISENEAQVDELLASLNQP